MAGTTRLELATSAVTGQYPPAVLSGFNRLQRALPGFHWLWRASLAAICAMVCATPGFAQARYDTIFLKPLPAGGVTSVSGLATVCPGTGLATTAASVTANVATLTFGSNPITAGFV